MQYRAKIYALANFNLFFFLKLFIKNRSVLIMSRRTRVFMDKSAQINVQKLFIDIKHGGQYFFSSNVLLKQGSLLVTGRSVNIFSGANLHLFENSQVSIGDDTYFSGPFTLHCKRHVSIGRRCSISWGVTIMDSNFHETNGSIYTQEVNIGDDVWIGTNVTVLPGVELESGCIIAAGSVLTKGYYQKGLWAGVPANLKRLL